MCGDVLLLMHNICSPSLQVTVGNDVMYVTENSWEQKVGGVRFHALTDRGLYKPSETVNVKGYAR